MHDLGIVLDSFESYKSKFPIRIHRINIDSIKDAKVVKRFNLVKRNAIIITTEQNEKNSVSVTMIPMMKIFFQLTQIIGQIIH